MNECTELHLQMKKAKLTEDVWLMDSPKLVRGSLERLFFFHMLWDSNPDRSQAGSDEAGAREWTLSRGPSNQRVLPASG